MEPKPLEKPLTQFDLSPLSQSLVNGDPDKDWVKATEEQIESLQNRTSALLQSFFNHFYSLCYLYLHPFFAKNLRKAMKHFGNNSAKG